MKKRTVKYDGQADDVFDKINELLTEYNLEAIGEGWSDYGTATDIIDAINPLLTKHGLEIFWKRCLQGDITLEIELKSIAVRQFRGTTY